MEHLISFYNILITATKLHILQQYLGGSSALTETCQLSRLKHTYITYKQTWMWFVNFDLTPTNFLCLAERWTITARECQTTRPLDNSPQKTHPWSSDLLVDKRMKNNLYDVNSWVHVFSSLFGSVVDKRTRNYLFEDWGKMSGANCQGGRLVWIPSQNYMYYSLPS